MNTKHSLNGPKTDFLTIYGPALTSLCDCLYNKVSDNYANTQYKNFLLSDMARDLRCEGENILKTMWYAMQFLPSILSLCINNTNNFACLLNGAQNFTYLCHIFASAFQCPRSLAGLRTTEQQLAS